jgi:carboxypeptidase C (cathepsin A)
VCVAFVQNKNANFLFIEQPAGVGFSYSDDVRDYTTGDAQTALDNYALIQQVKIINKVQNYKNEIVNSLFVFVCKTPPNVQFHSSSFVTLT